MRVGLYCIFDNKMKVYQPPLSAVNKAHAMRKFTQIVNNPNNGFLDFVEDYEVCYVGDYDDSCGLLVASDCLKLWDCSALVRSKEDVAK